MKFLKILLILGAIIGGALYMFSIGVDTGMYIERNKENI